MAISATAGVTVSNSTAGTSLATGTFTSTGGQDILVAIAIAASGVTVSSVTDTLSSTYSLKASATNSGNVRVELWQAQFVGGGTNAVTVTVSGSSLLAVAVEQYGGTANAPFTPLNRTGWVASSNDVYYGAAANAIDGNTSTIWATNGTMPCWLILDMLTAQTFSEVTVLPRQDGYQDFPGSISIFVSDDGATWGTAVYSTTGLPNNSSLKLFSFASQHHRYLQYEITAIASGARVYQGAAEVNVGNASVVPSQNTGTNTGSNYFPGERITVEDNGGWNVAAIAFASSSGDTFAASTGSTIRQSVVPALTSVAVALVDVAQGAASASILAEAKLSAARQWAVAGVELRTGASPAVFTDYTGRLPVDGTPLQKEQRFFGTMPAFGVSTPSAQSPAPVAIQIQGGVVGAAYSENITTVGGVGPFTYTLASGTLPPGTTLSSAGILSGVPSASGSYSFTIQSTDSATHAGSQFFSMTVIGGQQSNNFGWG